MSWANRNELWATALIDELARCTMAHITLSPGSRSTPLVLAAHDHPSITLHTLIDERSAAFMALGIGKATGAPAGVITTSGTAAVNLHPAIVEAHQAHVPLIALTADRPHRLRGQDANQAIDQVKLFGDHVRAFHELSPPTITDPALRHLRALACRAVAAATGHPPGPVHLNLPFDKPLEPTPVPGDIPEGFAQAHPLAAHGRPEATPFTRIQHPTPRMDPASLDTLADQLQDHARGVIMAGPTLDPQATGPAAIQLARTTGYPLIADPLSGARFTPGATDHALAHADLWLSDPDTIQTLAPEIVLRVGRSPTSKHVSQALQAWQQIPNVVLAEPGRHPDHLASASSIHACDPTDALTGLASRLDRLADPAWGSGWRARDQRAGELIEEELTRHPFEATVLRTVVDRLPSEQALFVSNSMPIRDLDAVAATRDEAIHVLANRGASGIDGIVSTAAGIAATTGPTVAVVGDLAMLHDNNGLQAIRDEDLPLVLVAIQNDGGGIFHQLPIRDQEPAFTPHFATPHGRDLAALAGFHSIPFTRTKGPGAFAQAFEDALDDEGPIILEVPSDREENRRRHAELTAQVQAATRDIDTQGGPR